jgi:hypothetical protein
MYGKPTGYKQQGDGHQKDPTPGWDALDVGFWWAYFDHVRRGGTLPLRKRKEVAIIAVT